MKLCFKTDAKYWRRRATVVAVLALIVSPAVVAPAAANALSVNVSLSADGLVDGATLGAAEIGGAVLRARVEPSGRQHLAVLTVDGRPAPLQTENGALVWKPLGLPDGIHRAVLSVPRTLSFPPAKREVTFTIDTRAPELSVQASAAHVKATDPVLFSGHVEDGATLTADGKRVPVGHGAFEVRYDAPPPGKVHFVATDAAGNTSASDVAVIVDVPPIRAVHVSAYAWATDDLRNGVIALIDQGKINAVELDLKDESGAIGYRSNVPLAQQIGASKAIYDLGAAVAYLHGRNVQVIGRLVAFRDPVLAGAAWDGGHHEEVIQTQAGEPYQGYGGFTNFANPAVQQYNIDIAEEAAKAGVDSILYDYVRRPDGPIQTMVFPGIQGSPEDNIVQFLAATRARLRPTHALLGASVFGVAATRPGEIAQDITRMAAESDFIAPMVYPSHWNKGEFGVADPNRQPYDIVARSLKTFQDKTAGTNAKIVPWLQDFSLGVDYGAPEVAAQIRAASDDGIQDWLLWDPAVTYTADGIPRAS
jgi:hypothetical protein